MKTQRKLGSARVARKKAGPVPTAKRLAGFLGVALSKRLIPLGSARGKLTL